MGHPTPGQRTGRTVTPRQILTSFDGIIRIPGGIVLDATYCKDGGNTGYTQELRAGVVLGQLPSGMWAPCKRTSLSAGNSGSGSGVSVTTLNVTDARFFQVGDIISIPISSAAGVNSRVARTLTAVDYTNNVLTFAVALVNNLVTGSGTDGISDHIIIHSDDTNQTGLSTPRAILGEHVDLVDHDDNTARDKTAGEVYVAAAVDYDLILGDRAAYRAADNQVDGHLRQIIWSDRQGY